MRPLAFVVRLFVHNPAFQNGLGPQDPDRIRDPTWCFGVSDPDYDFDHLLRLLFTSVLVRQIRRFSPSN